MTDPTIREWRDHLAAVAEGAQLDGRYGHSLYALTREIADRMHQAGVPHGLAVQFVRGLVQCAEELSPRDLMSEEAGHAAGQVLAAFVIGFGLGQNPTPLQGPDTIPEEAQ